MIICLIVAYLLNIVDYIFTARWVRKFGIEIEANPLGRWMFSHNIAWAVKIFAVGGLFALIGYFITRYPQIAWVTYVPLIIYVIIVIYHISIWINITFIK